MTEEEKEEIKRIKRQTDTTYEQRKNRLWYYLKISLNLIKNQQKEIDKLKEKNKKYQGIENGTTIIYKAKAKYVREDRIKKYYVDKNKIREKIEFYKRYGKVKNSNEYVMCEEIQVLEELLEEE